MGLHLAPLSDSELVARLLSWWSIESPSSPVEQRSICHAAEQQAEDLPPDKREVLSPHQSGVSPQDQVEPESQVGQKLGSHTTLTIPSTSSNDNLETAHAQARVQQGVHR